MSSAKGNASHTHAGHGRVDVREERRLEGELASRPRVAGRVRSRSVQEVEEVALGRRGVVVRELASVDARDRVVSAERSLSAARASESSAA